MHERTSSNSISQDVLIASRNSEYFHLDRSYFLLLIAACWLRTCSDLQVNKHENNNIVRLSSRYRKRFRLR